MAPPQSLADRNASLDAIVEQIKTQANPGTILVKIKDSDSFDDIKSKINNAITTLNNDREHLIENALKKTLNTIYSINLGYYRKIYQSSLNYGNIRYNISLKGLETDIMLLIFCDPTGVKFFLTTFEGDLKDEIASTTFIMPQGALVTNVMLTSTSTGRHFHLPTGEVQNFAATALYAPVDAAGWTSVSFKPADYDSISGMAGEIKAVTVSFVGP